MADYTEHYQLHQWEPEDSFLRTDFNEDHEKIDTALGALAQLTANHTAAIAKLGNCAIQHITYTGDGATSRTLTFSGKPMVVMVAWANRGTGFIAWRGMTTVIPHHQQYGASKVSLTWGTDSLSCTFNDGTDWGNRSGAAYTAIAFIDMSA